MKAADLKPRAIGLCLSLALALTFCLGGTNIVHAARKVAVCPIGCDHTTIQAAIDAAAPNDIIYVAPGTYLENLTFYDRQLTLTGEDAATTILSGDNAGRVLILYANSRLTLTNVTVRDGRVADNQGGGIYNDGVLIIDSSRVIDNRASVAGGGIANFGTLAITHSIVSGNSAYLGNGGGIVNGGQLTVTAATVAGNYASGRGGGVYHSVGAFTMIDSTVANNRADFAGGGIANFDRMSTTNSRISTNTTNGAGGGVLNGGHLTVASSTLTNNRASDGASLYNSGTLVMADTSMAGNAGGRPCTNLGIVISFGGRLENGAYCGPIAPVGPGGVAFR